MRMLGLLSLMLCTAAISGCGHSDVSANAAASKRTDPTPAIVLASATDTPKGWNATRWYALFEHVPAPPETLAQAGALVGPFKNARGDVQLGPIGKPLTQSRAQFKAAMAATNAAGVAAYKAEVAQPQVVAAQQLANKMQGASQAQQIQMAMQMAASMPRPTVNMAAMRAAGAMASYDLAQRQPLYTIETNLRRRLDRLESEYKARHAAANKAFLKIVHACPPIPYCGDTTDCAPQPACIKRVNTLVPGLIAQHRQIAQAELSAERAVYLHAKAALQPILARENALTVDAEQAGAPVPRLQTGYGTLSRNTLLLQNVDAAIVTRAGFWQGIRAKPVPDDFLVYMNATYGIPLGYSNPLGDPLGEGTAPSDIPDNW